MREPVVYLLRPLILIMHSEEVDILGRNDGLEVFSAVEYLHLWVAVLVRSAAPLHLLLWWQTLIIARFHVYLGSVTCTALAWYERNQLVKFLAERLCRAGLCFEGLLSVYELIACRIILILSRVCEGIDHAAWMRVEWDWLWLKSERDQLSMSRFERIKLSYRLICDWCLPLRLHYCIGWRNPLPWGLSTYGNCFKIMIQLHLRVTLSFLQVPIFTKLGALSIIFQLKWILGNFLGIPLFPWCASTCWYSFAADRCIYIVPTLMHPLPYFFFSKRIVFFRLKIWFLCSSIVCRPF